ncbi:MAG: cytochrome c oxidase subunit I [Gemmatimonas sp.]
MNDPSSVHVTERQQAFDRIWEVPRGPLAVLRTVDNIPIAIRYMATSFAFFIIGGILALVMRVQLARPENRLLSPEAYNQLFTMHGTTMMFLFVIPFLEAVANYLIPLQNGTRDLPFPRLTALSYWTYLFGGIFIYSSFLFGLAPDGGWFAYVPLNLKQYAPGLNMDFWDIGLSVAEIAAIGSAGELIIGILRMRAPGMSLLRMPLFSWAMLVTSVMIVFAFTPLIVGTAMLELDRKELTRFFDPNFGGNPLLWQHIFWMFGHPEVYIMFLPAVAVTSHIVQTFTGRPLMSYRLMLATFIGTGLLAFALWFHHMFAAGGSSHKLGFFVAASMTVSIPSAVQVFNWIATLWEGRPVWRTPLLFAIAGLVIFVIGGMTGVMVASVPFDLQAHDTYFVVAHLHYVIVGGVLFPIFGGLYYWIPKFSGRLLNETLGRWNAALMFAGFNLAFLPMHWAGLHGMPRRVYTYSAGMELDLYNLLSTIGAFILALGVLLFLLNLAVSLRRGLPAGNNPWNADTLEWLESSPPPNAQFSELPVIRSRHPLWAHSASHTSEDPFIAATARELSNAPTSFRGSLVVRVRDGYPIGIAHLPRQSVWPFVMSIAFTTVFVAALLDSLWIALTGLFVFTVSLIGWFWPSRTESLAIAEYAVPGHATTDGTATSLPLLVGERSSNGYWGTALAAVILMIALATIVGSHFYLLAGDRLGTVERVSPMPATATVAGVFAVLAVGATRWLSASLDVHSLRSRWIALALLVLLWNGAIWSSVYAYRTSGFTAAENAYGSSAMLLIGYAVLVGMAAMLFCTVALIWRLLAPSDPRGRSVALNASLISYSASISVLVAIVVVYVWPLIASVPG